MAEGHGQGCVGALFDGKPQVGEFRRLGIVGADDDGLGAAIAGLGVEVGVRGAGLGDVRPPQQHETGVVPVGALGHVGLLAPGLRRSRRQIAVPVIEGAGDPAQQLQIAGAGGVGHHGHGRDGREAEHPVGAPALGRIGVGGGDDLGDFLPVGPHEAAGPAHAGVGFARGGVVLDRGPGRDRLHRLAGLAPYPQQARADQRIFHPVGRIEIPAVAGAARAAPGFVIGQARSGARIVGLLGLPGHDPALYVDLPGAGPGAVHAVGRAHDLVMTPAASIGLLPAAILVVHDAVAIGEQFGLAGEEGETV